jgi:hypothetical protein
MKVAALLLVLVSLLVGGCREDINRSDSIPPSPPAGLRTQTGDNFIELFWDSNPESDVAGYNVFVSSTYEGRYELIGSTRSPYYLDNGARNGNVYYYAVTAYDFEGNESALSRDVAYDIPRPEGYGVVLDDYHLRPGFAGYDFSDYAILSYDHQRTDMYFENYDGTPYMNVRSDTDIQDVGYTNSLLDVRTAPSSGWSTTHDVRLSVGHTYVVWTWDDHYAKFRVTDLSPASVTFDWAYQLIKSNPLLKRAGAGGNTRHALHSNNVH